MLGELKGGAMKFGQALSIFEAALPAGIAGPLPGDPDQAAGGSSAAADRARRTRLAEELGPALAEAFRSTATTRPAAAAAIGQVHRAVGGRPA